MKKYILLAVILFTVQFYTNNLFAQKKDSLVRKEVGVEILGGTSINNKGIYFSGNFNYTRNKFQYTLQFNYYGYNYVNIDNVNLHEYLEYSHILALLAGYKFEIHEFSIIPMLGISIGSGRFADKNSYDNGYIYGMIGDNISYNKNNVFGFVFDGAFKYQITDKFNAGLTYTTFLNYVKSHPNFYYGLQLSTGYTINNHKKYHPNNIKNDNNRWEINIAGGFNFGKVEIKEYNTMIKDYSKETSLPAYFTNLSFTKIYHSGVALKFSFQNNRTSFEENYKYGPPILKIISSYDLINFYISGGYYHDFKKISLYSFIGTGASYLLAKKDIPISDGTMNFSTNIYNFSDTYGKQDTRWSLPIAFSLGINYKLNRLLSLSFNSGVDYYLTPFVLGHDAYNDYGFIAHNINQYSIHYCLGITFKIQKKAKQ